MCVSVCVCVCVVCVCVCVCVCGVCVCVCGVCVHRYSISVVYRPMHTCDITLTQRKRKRNATINVEWELQRCTEGKRNGALRKT